MKFRLPRQILTPNLIPIITREIRKQKIEVIRINKINLLELADVCEAIKEKGLPSYLVCKKLPNKLGSGIFLHPKANPILEDQIIGPYSGEVSLQPQNAPGNSCYAFAPIVDILLSKREQALFDSKSSYRPNRLYALDVDAQSKGNFIRFVNHSEKPNVVAHLFKIPKNTLGLEPSPIEVIYVAKKRIQPGEQLLVSYEGEEDSYWKNLKIRPLPIYPKTFQLDSSLKVVKTSTKN